MQDIKILCLGDSYTIGELVETEGDFPNQLVSLLQAKGINTQELKIIAKTGDTTFELAEKITLEKPHNYYDIVTLLIGVNNQYRGLSIEDYAKDFEALLLQSIAFANAKPDRVMVLSIPDWGMTPFNKERSVELTTQAIDDFNALNKQMAKKYNCHYIDITPSTRINALNPDFLAEDLLHPSAKEYAIWAAKLLETILPLASVDA